MKAINTFIIALVLLISFNAQAQDSAFIKLATNNSKTFTYTNQNFKGDGWNNIVDKVKKNTNVLIGEDHFSNEIPQLISEIVKTTEFDNFFIEVDPYSTKIIENSFKVYSEEKRAEFNKNYGELFSFYALKPEYKLLQQVINSGTNVLGLDQAVMYADALIFQDLITKTENNQAKVIYDSIVSQSKVHLEEFYKNPQNPMYLMTPEFHKQLQELKRLHLSTIERSIIKGIEKSIEIYQKGSHTIRVSLLMRQLMNDYQLWKNKKNLFKLGTNHLMRGESFLTVFDIGNLVANLTESNEKESLHIMVVGESGMVGRPIKTFPKTKVDSENGMYLKFLKPFFQITEGNTYYTFNLLPLRKALNQNKLNVDNKNLERVIKGYDLLVIIPELTPAAFIWETN